jgi:hypothetical protein
MKKLFLYPLPILVLVFTALGSPLRGETGTISAPVPTAPAAPAADPLFTPAVARDLFDSLDLAGPKFKAIRSALRHHDEAAAEHLLADYFRQRTDVPWKFDPHRVNRNIHFDEQIANDAVNGRVTGGLVPVWHDFPEGKIDWMYNATLVGNLAHNLEWQWQLCRMMFWEDMGAAYRVTGDEKYARAWVSQFRSFVAQSPVPAVTPTPPSAATPWRTIEAGIRMTSMWPDAYHSFLLSPSVSDRDLLLFVHECGLHARYLITHNGGGNWLTMEMAGLFTVGAEFPEFKQASAWRKSAVDRMYALEKDQFLPDGAHNELSTGYINVAIDNITALIDLAKLVGRMNELPAGYTAPLEKAYTYEMFLSTPNGQLPQFNDAWPSGIKGILHHALSYFPNRQDFQWFATQGAQGHPPAQTSRAFNWAGYYPMRSGWEKDANYLLLRAGPLGAGHAHQDKLTLIFWPYGREVLFNSGGATYEASKWRSYSVDTFSHNTVLVDGLSQDRDRTDRTKTISHTPIDARWESTPDHDFVAGIYDDAYGSRTNFPAVHSRRVLFLKPDLAIVSDTLTPKNAAAHTYQARWHLLTTHSQLVDATHEVVTTDPGLPNLDIVPLVTDGLTVRAASAQTEPELLGWDTLHSGEPAIPATTVLQTREGTGVQRFLTLLVPMRAGSPDPIQKVTTTGPNAAEVTFTDGRKLVVQADTNPAGGIEATETLADGSAGRHVKAGTAR